MKVNTPFLIVGIVLAIIAIVGIFFVGSLLNPEPVPVPVAITDIPAGTTLQQNQFRLEEWNGVQPQTLVSLFTSSDFPVGFQTLVDVPAGSPLYKAYVSSEATVNYAVRMSQYVSGTQKVVMAIPVKPDTGGNIPVNGDQVDLVFSLGAVQAREMQSHPQATPTASPYGRPATTGTLRLQETEETTQTLPLPFSVLVLENVPVLQVDCEKITQPGGGSGLPGDADNAPVVVDGDAQRLYVTVNREQAETLAFLLHNGDVLLAVHPADGRATDYPGGITWEDFEIQFFARRPTPTPNP